MNRNDLKRLANTRMRDAKRLINAKSYSGAYYLAGLAIECALKACIAKQTRQHDFPDKKHANKCFEHDPVKLSEVAALDKALKKDFANNQLLEANWGIVAQWSVESRYDIHSEQDATELYSAIAAKKNGVLNWLRKRW